MINIKTCIFCSSTSFSDLFLYEKPPEKETIYNKSIVDSYSRKISRCNNCGHMYSIHNMNLENLYTGNYNSSIYTNLEGMNKTFQKISSLDENKSDNAARCKTLDKFIKDFFKQNENSKIKILDIGSGLGIFPWKMAEHGYAVTGFDPDPNAIRHLEEYLKIPAICGDYLKDELKGIFDVITLNKVLEHVKDPILMLQKTLKNLSKNGLVYIELPDGEVASREGKDREEFTIDHLHVFSLQSASLLINKAGFKTLDISRLKEPSSKYTMRAFAVANL